MKKKCSHESMPSDPLACNGGFKAPPLPTPTYGTQGPIARTGLGGGGQKVANVSDGGPTVHQICMFCYCRGAVRTTNKKTCIRHWHPPPLSERVRGRFYRVYMGGGSPYLLNADDTTLACLFMAALQF